MEDLEKLKYPIGSFKAQDNYTAEVLSHCISSIESLPGKLRSEVKSLDQRQLDTLYRPGGWSVIQVVNHLADSHMNALIRVKVALTEEKPTIKPYLQDLWVNLPDGKMPVESSLHILEGLHARWVTILKSLNQEQWKRGFIHPEKGKELSLGEATASYAWHGEHHLAHITGLKKRMNW